MKELEYSAGNVSKGFWFNEFKKYNYLLREGKTDKEIKKMQKEENILLAPSVSYGIKKVGEVSRRTRVLPESIIKIFSKVSISDQKIINVISIMMTDRLFFEYVYEIYRSELILGAKNFEDSKVRVFFNNKSNQSEKVASFSDVGKKRLAGAYKTFLKEANLIVEKDGELIFNKPLLDIDLENALKDSDLYPYLKALLGVD